MTLKTLTIAMLCGTASAGYSISSMLTTRRKKTPGTAGSIRGAAAPDGPSDGKATAAREETSPVLVRGKGGPHPRGDVVQE